MQPLTALIKFIADQMVIIKDKMQLFQQTASISDAKFPSEFISVKSEFNSVAGPLLRYEAHNQ